MVTVNHADFAFIQACWERARKLDCKWSSRSSFVVTLAKVIVSLGAVIFVFCENQYRVGLLDYRILIKWSWTRFPESGRSTVHRSYLILVAHSACFAKFSYLSIRITKASCIRTRHFCFRALVPNPRWDESIVWIFDTVSCRKEMGRSEHCGERPFFESHEDQMTHVIQKARKRKVCEHNKHLLLCIISFLPSLQPSMIFVNVLEACS